jgi:hypothetical protein
MKLGVGNIYIDNKDNKWTHSIYNMLGKCYNIYVW